MSKFKYLVVATDNSVYGTNDLDAAIEYGDDEDIIIDTEAGEFVFAEKREPIEELAP
jgi:hypothetical protein